MGDEYKECDKKKCKNTDGNNLEDTDSNIGKEGRNNKGKDHKSKSGEKGSDIDEKKSEVKMKSNVEIMECHIYRETDSLESFFVLKDNKEFRIGKEYIDEKSKDKIYKYANTNREEIILPKDTEKKEIESDDWEELKKRHCIMEFKYREKVKYPLRYTISNPVNSFTIICFLFYEWQESYFCYRCDENIEDNCTTKDDEYLYEIRFMNKLNNEGKELVFETEYIDIRKGNLIQDDESEIDGWKEWWKEIEFFDEGFMCDEFPGREDDFLFKEEIFLMFSW